MEIEVNTFRKPDEKTDSYHISIAGQLLQGDTEKLRSTIAQALLLSYENIYIDTRNVTESDLSGINEIINAHYLLSNAGKKLFFLYRRQSAIEKWVETTGLDQFVQTAIVPE